MSVLAFRVCPQKTTGPVAGETPLRSFVAVLMQAEFPSIHLSHGIRILPLLSLFPGYVTRCQPSQIAINAFSITISEALAASALAPDISEYCTRVLFLSFSFSLLRFHCHFLRSHFPPFLLRFPYRKTFLIIHESLGLSLRRSVVGRVLGVPVGNQALSIVSKMMHQWAKRHEASSTYHKVSQ
jgi:hypothetical protein